jgi:hypothetical protein
MRLRAAKARVLAARAPPEQREARDAAWVKIPCIRRCLTFSTHPADVVGLRLWCVGEKGEVDGARARKVSFRDLGFKKTKGESRGRVARAAVATQQKATHLSDHVEERAAAASGPFRLHAPLAACSRCVPRESCPPRAQAPMIGLGGCAP